MRNPAVRLATVFAALVLILSPLGACALVLNPSPSPSVAVSVQQQYIEDVNAARKALHEASASVQLGETVQMNRTFPIDLHICSNRADPHCIPRWPCIYPSIPTELVDSNVDRRELERKLCKSTPADAPTNPLPESTASSLNAGQAAGLGVVEIGGRVQADLVSYEPEFEIARAGSAVLTMTKLDDVGQWRWDVVAKHSGKFHVRITVTPLKEDSDVGLGPAVNLDFMVRVDANSGAMAYRMAAGLGNWLGGGPGVAALVTAAGGIALIYLKRQDGEEAPWEVRTLKGGKDGSSTQRPAAHKAGVKRRRKPRQQESGGRK